MFFISEQFAAVTQFLHTGGTVLWLILVVSICLWCLIVERLVFFKRRYPLLKKQWVGEWNTRTDKSSPSAKTIRVAMISEAKLEMAKMTLIIKMLIALCPLMGLLGTVTGMIHVFDIMAVTGTGNARAMASGVSQATIPTMAGMVVAIAGLYFSRYIEDRTDDETHHLADLLKFH